MPIADNVIRVMLADDQEICRDGYERMLATAFDVEVVGKVETAQAILDGVQRFNPHVVIIDLNWYGDTTAGATAIRELKELKPEIKLIAITVHPDLIGGARAAGADAALNKDFTRDRLLTLIRDLMSRTSIFPAAENASPGNGDLTNREIEVLMKLTNGLSDKQIAGELSLAESTVKNHLQSIYSKLGANNRAHAVTLARYKYLP